MRQWLSKAFRKDANALPAARDVFASVSDAPLIEDPYPHMAIDEAVPRVVADTLLADIPPLEVFTRGKPAGSNVRFPLPSPEALADPRISESWKSALRVCLDASQDLLDRFIARFGSRLLASCPDFEKRFGPIDKLRAVPRYGPRDRGEVGMDAQIVINSPPLVDDTRVRGPHLDVPDKLISALLYLRPADDDSVGGELDLYAPAVEPVYFGPHHSLPLDKVRRVRTYPYRHNLFILPLPSVLSLHGVTPRARTPRPRYHLHIAGELTEPLFTAPRAPKA